MENWYSHKYLNINVYSVSLYSLKKLKKKQENIFYHKNRKKYVVLLYIGVLLTIENQTIDVHSSMDKSQMHYTKWK